ncbi:MAG: efflux RND transporter periplasmic adaptor subunit [Nitrospirae bacterium]|nr:efflux RND transporter periplasmic adaptor subunit [Candidatus Manganitrophaceae bacterium]
MYDHFKNKGLCFVFCAFCTVFFVGCEPGPDQIELREKIKKVEVFIVKTEDFEETIVASAVASAHMEYRISTEVSGLLKIKQAEWGDRVKKGETLFEIDSENFILIVKAKKAALARALAQLGFMQAEHKRKKPLLQSKTLSQAGWEKLQFDLAAAISEKNQAQVALDQAQRNLRLTVLKSPIDGMILETYHDTGEVIAVGTVLARMADTTWMTFDVGVSDLELSHLNLGDTVFVRIDALSKEERKGQITRISGNASPTRGTFPLEVRLENAKRSILPGMVARLRLSGEKHKTQVIIPMMAIHQENDIPFVFLVQDQKALRRPVKLGKVLGDRVLIQKGLKPGDAIVLIAQGRLKIGEPLDVIQASVKP